MAVPTWETEQEMFWLCLFVEVDADEKWITIGLNYHSEPIVILEYPAPYI